MTNHALVALSLLAASCAGHLEPQRWEPPAVHPEPSGTAAPDAPSAAPAVPADDPASEWGYDPPSGPPGGATLPPADTGTGAPPVVPVRFVVLGDGGRGTQEQYDVAAAIEQVCAANGCDFALHTGDNIYEDGVEDVYDPQFQDKFELPYANLDFPFWMVLGNHDWHQGQDGVDAQVAYTGRSDRWNMPAQYYTIVQGDVTVFGLDTDPITEGNGDDQAAWLARALSASATTWKLAFGHHPYLSNGDHGNAEEEFATFVEDNLCGTVDVYFAGHDHDLQWLAPTCGTEFVVSGAASSLRDVGGKNPTLFEASTLGFLWVEIVDRTLTGVFYDSDGTELFRRQIQK